MRSGNFSARQLMELDACTRCGECVRWCQAYAEGGEKELGAPAARLQELRKLLKREHHLVHRLLGRGKLSDERLKELSAGAYRCTLCSRCVPACPAKIDLRGLWLSVREDLVTRGAYPPGLNLARDAIVHQRNVVNYPNDERAMWVDYMMEAREDAYRRETAEVVYFVGCMASFSPAVQSIPEAFVQLLDRSGLDFTILGEGEWCCGFPLLAAGMKREAEELKKHHVEAIRQTGAKTVVFTCPSCYNTWVNEYSALIPEVELLHSTQLLARLAGEGRLPLGTFPHRVTYHDPCDLGRNSGVFEAPRAVLRRIPGAQYVEVSPNRDRGLCCGGGGDLEIADPALAAGEARSSLRAFEATGADTLVCACQQCKRLFLAAREATGSKLQVLDIVEVVLMSLAAGSSAAGRQT